jgi:hypothetical protein
MRMLGAIAGVGLATLLSASCTGGASPPPSSSPTQIVTSGSPPEFSFASVRITPAPVVSDKGTADATKVGQTIEGTLRGFYQIAFADPSLWGKDLPAETWSAFAPALREHAAHDAESLTLGGFGLGVQRLTFTRKDLVVRVLLDQNGRPQAALASATVEADANRTDGQTLLVSSHVTFLFEPGGSSWLIQGYPDAKTTGRASS